MSLLAELDRSNVVDVDLGSAEFKANAHRHMPEWARRRPFYVLGKGPPQVVVGRYADVRRVFSRSPGCDHCYAKSWSKRSGLVQWGKHPRRRTSESDRQKPFKWNAQARAFIVSASMAVIRGYFARHLLTYSTIRQTQRGAKTCLR